MASAQEDRDGSSSADKCTDKENGNDCPTKQAAAPDTCADIKPEVTSREYALEFTAPNDVSMEYVELYFNELTSETVSCTCLERVLRISFPTEKALKMAAAEEECTIDKNLVLKIRKPNHSTSFSNAGTASKEVQTELKSSERPSEDIDQRVLEQQSEVARTRASSQASSTDPTAGLVAGNKEHLSSTFPDSSTKCDQVAVATAGDSASSHLIRLIVLLDWPHNSLLIRQHLPELNLRLLQVCDCRVTLSECDSGYINVQWQYKEADDPKDQIADVLKQTRMFTSQFGSFSTIVHGEVNTDGMFEQAKKYQVTVANEEHTPYGRTVRVSGKVSDAKRFITTLLAPEVPLMSDTNVVLDEEDIGFLNATGFWSHINSSSIKVTGKLDGFRIQGHVPHVDAFLKDMYQYLYTKRSATFIATELVIKFLRLCLHKDLLKKIFGTSATPFVRISSVTSAEIYCIGEKEAATAVRMLHDAFQEEILSFDVPVSAELLQSSEWSERLTDIMGTRALLDNNTNQLRVAGWSSDIRDIVAQVQQFVKENSPVNKRIPLNDTESAYMERFMKNELLLMTEHWNYVNRGIKLMMKLTSGSIDVSGNSDGVNAGTAHVHLLCQSLIQDVAEFDVPSWGRKCLNDRVRNIEDRTKTVIKVLDNDDELPISRSFEASQKSLEDTPPWDELRSAYRNLKHPVQVQPVLASLCDVEADVVVNSIDQTLDLTFGASSNALHMKAGPEMQRDLWFKYGRIKFNEMAISKGYNLPCKYVLHVACAPYKQGKSETSEGDLLNIFCMCLREAERLQAKSVAFPAIGCGQLGYPVEAVFRMLLSAVDSFAVDHPQPSLIHVKCAIFDERTLQTFNAVKVSHGNKYPGTKVAEAAGVTATQRRVQGRPCQAAHVQLGELNLQIVHADTPRKDIPRVTLRLTANRKKLKSSKDTDVIYVNRETILSNGNGSELVEALVQAEQGLHAQSVQILGFSPDGVRLAHKVVELIYNYTRTRDSTIVRNICIVVDTMDMVKAFQAAASEAATAQPSRWSPKYWFKTICSKVGGNPSEMVAVKDVECRIHVAVYGTRSQIDNAKKEIKDCLENEKKDDWFDVENEEDLKELNELQISQLENCCRQSNTRIWIDKGQNRVTVGGYKDSDIAQAMYYAKKFVSEAAAERAAEKETEALLQKVRWKYQVQSGQWISASPAENMHLENAYTNRSMRASSSASGPGTTTYSLHSDQYSNTSLSGLVHCRLQRIDMTKLTDCPPTWEPSEEYLEVILAHGTAEYDEIESEFMCNAGASADHVIEIKRIQDPHVWKMYIAQKERLISSMNLLPKDAVRRLWHGTSFDTIRKILKEGRFNRSFAGDAVLYGKGAYFARDASYAAQPQYAAAHTDGSRRVILAEVCTGKYVKGDPRMTTPPCLPNSDHLRFNSTVDDEDNPAIFVIYHDAQAYPLYVITYK